MEKELKKHTLRPARRSILEHERDTIKKDSETRRTNKELFARMYNIPIPEALGYEKQDISSSNTEMPHQTTAEVKLSERIAQTDEVIKDADPSTETQSELPEKQRSVTLKRNDLQDKHESKLQKEKKSSSRAQRLHTENVKETQNQTYYKCTEEKRTDKDADGAQTDHARSQRHARAPAWHNDYFPDIFI